MKRKLKRIKNQFPLYLGSRFGHLFLHLLFATCRLSEFNREKMEKYRESGKSGLVMFWHCVLTPPFYYFHRRNMTPLIGLHKDAEVLAKIGERLGYRSLRGSSNRRSEAVSRELILFLQQKGNTIAMTPDGPRGPARVPKPGSLKIARSCGAMIYPLGVAYSRYKVLNSWDKFRAIKPFSKIVLFWGDPILPDKNMPTEKLIEEVKQAIESAQSEAERLLDPSC